MTAYYNENDPMKAVWLRELMGRGLIAPGEVDERSVDDVRPGDLAGFVQCHFFAGIGIWSYALRLAGYPDDRPVWTGSCPCQPFSAAGKGDGFADERHVWPAWFWLIEQCCPERVFGEQVASNHGLAWLDLVQADMEAAGYSIGAVDLCAAGLGAPHIRQRLFFVADSEYAERGAKHKEHSHAYRRNGFGRSGDVGVTQGDAKRARLEGHVRNGDGSGQSGRNGANASRSTSETSGSVQLAESVSARISARISGRDQRGLGASGKQVAQPQDGSNASDELSDRREDAGLTNGFWRDCEWLPCRDGKARPVEPGTSPLAHGVAERVGLLRGYGDGIVAPVAAAFIEASIETYG